MPTDSSSKPRVLLIGWDGADWDHIHPLLDEGLMPTLQSMLNEGVMGNLATLQPILSPILWNTVATGKLAHKHGIHGFIEPDPVNGGIRPYTSTSRKCKALWNICSQRGLTSNVVGWWASHPAEPIRGTVVSNHYNGTRYDEIKKSWTIAPHTIHPAEQQDFLAQFKLSPSELTREHILPFIPQAHRINQRDDKRYEAFGKVLSDCASIHAVATTIMDQGPWDFTAVYYDAIDHFCHTFMHFHPPQMPNVSDEDFEVYREVVRGAYRFHDMMLERLLQLAGPDAYVILCSDHGFESKDRRPLGLPREPAGPAVWHRDFGMVVIKGPNIKQDEVIHGASLIDIGPTVLAMLDLPIGEDMDGRPLVDAFREVPEIEYIPSWEDVPGDCGMHPPGTELSEKQSEDLLEQFVALGYIEDQSGDKEKLAQSARIESQYNLARQFLFVRRADEAIELLEDIVRQRPWELRFLVVLAHAYFHAGYLRQSIRLIERTYPNNRYPPGMLVLLGKIKFLLGEREQAAALIQSAQRIEHKNPDILVELAIMHLGRRDTASAKHALDQALALHPQHASALECMSTIYLRERDYERAAETALDAIELIHYRPLAHLNLGIAMARLGSMARAKTAFETALKISPGLRRARRWLAKANGERFSTEETGNVASATMDLRMRKKRRNDRASKLLDLPEIPPPNKRLEILNKERPLETAKAGVGNTFFVVSGLPRSGTSLMMQILQAGGLQVIADGERVADVDNPAGYLEWEAIKRITKEPDLLDDEQLSGKAIKVVSPLLSKLPRHHKYVVLFMMRPVREVVLSQQKMIDRLGSAGAESDEEDMAHSLNVHRDSTLKWLADQDNFRVLQVQFPELVADPVKVVARVREFVGEELLPNVQAMHEAVQPELYRQRS